MSLAVFGILINVSIALAIDQWIVEEGTSPMDDSRTVTVRLEAENTVKGWLTNERPWLIIRCLENKTELAVLTGMSSSVEYGSLHRHTVRIRLDDDKPFSEKWSESTDDKALFAPRGIALAKKIAKAKKMLFEFVPFRGKTAIVEFSVDGLNKHLKKVADACNWKI